MKYPLSCKSKQLKPDIEVNDRWKTAETGLEKFTAPLTAELVKAKTLTAANLLYKKLSIGKYCYLVILIKSSKCNA